MTTMTQGYRSEYTQEEQLENWAELIAYFRWYPDIFLSWITPTEVDEETGKIKKLVSSQAGADQRLLLRTMCRFPYNFEVLSRGYGQPQVRQHLNYQLYI